ncbi:hypothetical protein ANCDUO_09976 [Ancylostoma duodenale]|uniref:ATP-dependent DNA helicase n=1 Tax=Ancylostoma duodenale TaxID=51022 RepID=A0A0C2CSG6_9BILA|nr:hypothetical protein ANCDUO_09976 [Ancylostoma duodenale]
MAHKRALEALDRTLQDIRGEQPPYGGAVVLLAGDFRQTLPIYTCRQTQRVPQSLAYLETSSKVNTDYKYASSSTGRCKCAAHCGTTAPP